MENPIIYNSLGHYSTQVSFNSYNASLLFFHELHNYFVYQENMHICNSYNLCLLHMNFSILRKCCAEYVNKVRLVKRTYM